MTTTTLPSARRTPQARRTTHAGLAGVAYRLAAQEHLWRPLVRFDSEQRCYTRLSGPTDGYEAWLLTWLPGQRTGLHDHGGSAGAFTVLDGAVDELTLPSDPVNRVEQAGDAWAGAAPVLTRRTYVAGAVRAFGPEHLHDVVNGSTLPAVTLHVYAPRLTRMTRYELAEDGVRVVSRERAGQDW